MTADEYKAMIESEQRVHTLVMRMTQEDEYYNFNGYHSKLKTEVEKLYQFIDQCKFNEGR